VPSKNSWSLNFLSRSVNLPLCSLYWITITKLVFHFRLVSYSTTLSIRPFRSDNRDAIVFAFCAVSIVTYSVHKVSKLDLFHPKEKQWGERH